MSGELLANDKVTLMCGDSRERIREIPDNSIDSVVTDPPYALVSIVKRYGKKDASPNKDYGKSGVYQRAAAGFMGAQWDTGETAFAPDFWEDVLRVLKPGGHLISFSGTRTYHRMACAIEDAGFEIRDQLAWAYGSGFPKSHNVGKGIDKKFGVEFSSQPASGVGFMGPDGPGGYNVTRNRLTRVGDMTEAAHQWDGWGTALKPAWEPICLARKPLIGTVVDNVLAHGVGGINIDGCRIGEREARELNRNVSIGFGGSEAQGAVIDGGKGRFPANIIHDGSDEVVAAFPSVGDSHAPANAGSIRSNKVYGEDNAPRLFHAGFADSGSAARFFYSAKADSDDRLGSKHPTVKPVDLMQYLVRLVTPPGGTVLDCFAGTGTTGEAAFREGMRAVLIEREAEYQNDIRRRMTLVLGGRDERKHASLKASGKVEDAGPLFASL